MLAVGAGVAVTVKVAAVPSVTPLPPVTLTDGTDGAPSHDAASASRRSNSSRTGSHPLQICSACLASAAVNGSRVLDVSAPNAISTRNQLWL